MEESRKRKVDHADVEHTFDHPPRIHVHYEDPEHVHKRRRNERKIRQETAWLYHESPVPSPPEVTAESEISGAAETERENMNEPESSAPAGVRANGSKNNLHQNHSDTETETTCAVEDSIGHAAQDKESDSEESSCESTPENLSDISSISDGEHAWRPVAGPISWVQRQMALGQSPHVILSQLLPDGTSVPDDVPDFYLWKVIVNLLSEPPRRKKLDHVNTFSDVVGLIQSCKKIMVLTGAGVSVSCGIPDFRSRDGIYSRLAVDYPDLPDPQAMFDIHYFKSNQKPFFQFAREFYPGQFQPSPSHKFIQLLEKDGRLLRNYTQNIDTLEQVAGISNVVQCHGSFATATCMVCHSKVDCEEIKPDIFNQVIPRCRHCPAETELAIMKPDIVFFGESLPDSFHHQMAEDKDHCDLLIVIGSSLKVRPVALIPSSVDASIPQILINREPLNHLTFDVELLGDCDIIISEICRRLGRDWSDHICATDNMLSECQLSDLALPPPTKEQHGESEPVPVAEAEAGTLSSEPITAQLDVPTASSSGLTENDGKVENGTGKEEDLNLLWEGSLSQYLKKNTFVHIPPCRYVFEGAEILCSDGGNDSDEGAEVICSDDDVESNASEASNDEADSNEVVQREVESTLDQSSSSHNLSTASDAIAAISSTLSEPRIDGVDTAPRAANRTVSSDSNECSSSQCDNSNLDNSNLDTGDYGNEEASVVPATSSSCH